MFQVLTGLPQEIILKILLLAPTQTTINLIKTSVLVNKLSQSPNFWKEKLDLNYPNFWEFLINDCPIQTLRELDRIRSIPVYPNQNKIEITGKTTLEKLFSLTGKNVIKIKIRGPVNLSPKPGFRGPYLTILSGQRDDLEILVTRFPTFVQFHLDEIERIKVGNLGEFNLQLNWQLNLSIYTPLYLVKLIANKNLLFSLDLIYI